MRKVVLTSFCLVGGMPAAAEDCSPLPLELSGNLLRIETEHPNGTPIVAHQVQLDQPIGVEGILSDGCVLVKLVHLIPAEGAE